MIYVIQSNGKGDGRADYVKLLTFLSDQEAKKHIAKNERKYSDGNKYWVRFDFVEPGVTIENCSE